MFLELVYKDLKPLYIKANSGRKDAIIEIRNLEGGNSSQ